MLEVDGGIDAETAPAQARARERERVRGGLGRVLCTGPRTGLEWHCSSGEECL